MTRIPFSKEVELPYNAKNSKWYFRITLEGQVLKVANLQTKSLIQVDRLADIDALTAQQLEESEECTPEEVELQIELAKANAIPVFFPVPLPIPAKHFNLTEYVDNFFHNLIPHHQ